MHSAFNQLVFPNSMFTPLFFIFYLKGYVLSGEIALKNNHYYYYYYKKRQEKKQCYIVEVWYIAYIDIH